MAYKSVMYYIGTISIYVVNGSVNEYDLKVGKYIHTMYVLATF